MPQIKGWELFQEYPNGITWHSREKTSQKLAYQNIHGKLFPIPKYILHVERIRPNLASNETLWRVVLAGQEHKPLGIYPTKERARKIAIKYMKSN